LQACDKQNSSESTAKDNATMSTSVENSVSNKESLNTKFPQNVYFGDTHNHSGNSFDVYLFGTPNSTPDIAYRYAKGEQVINPATGTEWQINTPLDFLVVADHSELMGTMPRLYAGEKLLSETKSGKVLIEIGGSGTEEDLLQVYNVLNYAASNLPNDANLAAKDLYTDLHSGNKRQLSWEQYIDATESHNEPGKFTTLIGWEWSSTPNGANLHRVVFTPQNGEVAKKFIPYSSLESIDPEDLWQWLDNTSEKLGADFVVIPHNPNLSLGMMFPITKFNGEAIDADYAKNRMYWERSVEATQIKGDSEAHPALSPNDEFADFETYSFALTPDGIIAKPDKADYVRSALKRGLELKSKIGVNPYKVGMVGSTDSHTGIAAVEENNFAGKGQHDAKPEIRSHATGIGSSKGWDMGAAGYTGVWATENTREALVAAFQRKEVYTTTGPRISLRFFGGFDFNKKDENAKNLAAIGYQKGVPMGGDISNAQGKAASFLAAVMKDPNGANLDRMQIVKGWVDSDGNAHERIYDLAVSGSRTINIDGRAMEAVGNTVDLTTGKYTNTIGSAQLTVAWVDPDFDASVDAFYYIRALEIPTPRYSLLDAIKLGINWQDTNHPATIQERVYSSPIWYTH